MRLKSVSWVSWGSCARWDQVNVRWKCIPGTWPGDGKDFVS